MSTSSPKACGTHHQSPRTHGSFSEEKQRRMGFDDPAWVLRAGWMDHEHCWCSIMHEPVTRTTHEHGSSMFCVFFAPPQIPFSINKCVFVGGGGSTQGRLHLEGCLCLRCCAGSTQITSYEGSSGSGRIGARQLWFTGAGLQERKASISRCDAIGQRAANKFVPQLTHRHSTRSSGS